ncbi:MAG: dipeptide epimerase [Actinomycetota bacterium]|nr:dipeptide epimerase [Actinomycetota bacterium]
MTDAGWSLETRVVELALRERFTIARQSWDSATSVFAIVRHHGWTGVGEAQPADRWGESTTSVVAQLADVDLGRLAGPFDLEGVGSLLPAGSARCALDIAMHDLVGQRAGLSVSELIGAGGRSLPPTSVTAPIAELDTIVDRARSLRDHPILKMKVGFDGDVDAVRAVREVFPGAIRIDANEGWSRTDALERLPALAEHGIELCEQPVPAGNHADLAAVTAASPIPVFADEDVCTAEDVARLKGKVHGVNLKLRKTGGIRELVCAIAVARACGMKVMLGCDLESGVAITAAAHVAALADHVDLDGPLLLADDPFPGVAYERGVMTLPSGPGLGLAARPG